MSPKLRAYGCGGELKLRLDRLILDLFKGL